MPLPFQTADRAAAANADGAALPHRDQGRERWRRPYRPGPWRVGTAALVLLLASYVLFAAMIIAFTGALPAAGVCVAAAAGVIAFALRLLRRGIWVSPRGLRRVGLLHSTTLPWPRVAAVRVAQQPVKWLGTPRTVQGQALLVTPVGGEPLRPLLTDHNADFLGRAEAFDRAADAVETWAAEFRVRERA